jgi:hypothetical protein
MTEIKIVVKAIIEIVGGPKEHVEDTLKKVVKNLKDNFKVLRYKIYETKEIKKLWSAFSEIEIEFDSLNKLFGLCYDYFPSSIEILEPIKFELKNKDFEDLLNDLLAKLHLYSMIIKKLQAEDILLKKRLNEMVGKEPKKEKT